MAVGQNQRYHFGVGAPPIFVGILVGIGMFTGGTICILTHGNMCDPPCFYSPSALGSISIASPIARRRFSRLGFSLPTEFVSDLSHFWDLDHVSGR